MTVGQKEAREAAAARRGAAILYEEGKEQLKLGHYPEAVGCFIEAASAAKASGSAALLARSLFELGRAHSELGHKALAEDQKLSAARHFQESLRALEDCGKLGAAYQFQSAVLAHQTRKTLRGLGIKEEAQAPPEPSGNSRAILAAQAVPFHEWEFGAKTRDVNIALFALLADYDTKEAQLMGLLSAANGFHRAAEAADGRLERAASKAAEGTALALLGIFNEDRRPEYFSEAYRSSGPQSRRACSRRRSCERPRNQAASSGSPQRMSWRRPQSRPSRSATSRPRRARFRRPQSSGCGSGWPNCRTGCRAT